MSSVTLERWSPAGWGELAKISLLEPEHGLHSPMRLDYDTGVILLDPEILPEPADFDEDNDVPIFSLPFVQWPSPAIPGDVFRTYEGEPVAALLRDLIPSGWARRRLLEKMGHRRQDGPHFDLALLQHGTCSPIGNLRINHPGSERATQFAPIPLDLDKPSEWHSPLVSLEYEQGEDRARPLWAGLGAGGESPKLLVNRCGNGQYYLDGNETHAYPITDHWLVKWPREPVTRNRVDILYAEYLYLQALETLGLNVPEVQWREDTLWVRRFDRGPGGERYSVESLYNVMGRIGNGARLSHIDALDTILSLASDPDEMLIEYLIRDHINRLLGNCDNHGRNTAFHRTDRGIHLTPLYDVAPMVMDEDGIAWATTWPRDWLNLGHPDWVAIVQRFAHDVERVFDGLQSRCAALTDLEQTAQWRMLPESVRKHTRVMPISVPIDLYTCIHNQKRA